MAKGFANWTTSEKTATDRKFGPLLIDRLMDTSRHCERMAEDAPVQRIFADGMPTRSDWLRASDMLADCRTALILGFNSVNDWQAAARLRLNAYEFYNGKL